MYVYLYKYLCVHMLCFSKTYILKRVTEFYLLEISLYFFLKKQQD